MGLFSKCNPPFQNSAHGSGMLQEWVALCVTYERKDAPWKELTEAVTYFIAKDFLPRVHVIKTPTPHTHLTYRAVARDVTNIVQSLPCGNRGLPAYALNA